VLLAHAILFFGLHDGIPAATSARNQNQNMPTRYFAFGNLKSRLPNTPIKGETSGPAPDQNAR
jgi:hypothetical protein